MINIARRKLTERNYGFTLAILNSAKHFKPSITDVAKDNDLEDNKLRNALTIFWRNNKHKFNVEVKIALKDEEDQKELNRYINKQNELKYEAHSNRM